MPSYGIDRELALYPHVYFQSLQIFALDGRKIFESVTPPDALPRRAFLPRCYVLQGQLRSGNNIIEQICN